MRELQRNREFLIALERGTTVYFTVPLLVTERLSSAGSQCLLLHFFFRILICMG